MMATMECFLLYNTAEVGAELGVLMFLGLSYKAIIRRG